jgi:hypothetical protein
VGKQVTPNLKDPTERSVVTLLCTTVVLPSATLTFTGELIGTVGRVSSCNNVSLTKLALAPLSKSTLTSPPARFPTNSIQVDDKSGVSTIICEERWAKESKHVCFIKGFSLTVRTQECTENMYKGKSVLQPKGGELPLAVGKPKWCNIAAENRRSP